MTKRERGEGSVTAHGERHRARLPRCYGRKSVGVYDTPEEAQAVLDAALLDLAADPTPIGQTFDAFGVAWLAKLIESPHYKRTSVARDVTRWRCYVTDSLLGKTPLADVSEADVRRWLAGLRGKRGKPLAGQTLSNALSLVRRALDAARQDQIVEANPAAEVRLPKGARVQRGDRWTWLHDPEIAVALECDAIPLRARSIYTTAIYAGLRAGELWGLRREDLDFTRRVIHVRHSYDGAPKSWQIREVPMLAPVAEALRAWLALVDATHVRSRHGLVWSSADEGCHAEGYDAGWSDRVEGKGADRKVTPGHKSVAGIKRAVRFHDLRHTCASHLIQGTWAPELMERALRIEEVKTWLGHSDVAVTQRYAHLGSDAIRSLVVSRAPALPGHDRDTVDSHLRELNSGPTVYETGAVVSIRGTKRDETAPVSRDVSRQRLRDLATRYGRAVASNDPHRDHRGLDLMEAVLDATAEQGEPGAEASVKGDRK